MQTIGRYEIREKLGQGGMGIVYKAYDPLIERVVAVKMISAQFEDNPDLRVRFLREARAAGQLSHKNIITIYDLGEEQGQVFLAMEFLEGEDLAAKLLHGHPMRLERKIDLMADLCEGLAHAHSKGIVHRDLKPGNVFITTSGQVKILDFGLARMLSSELTRSHTTIGTPHYMSPEQVRGERVDHRSDIFSLGVVFYELLTSKKPFTGDSFASVIYKILQVEPEPIEQVDPGVPIQLSDLVRRAMAKDLAERYQLVTELQLGVELLRQSRRSGQFAISDRIPSPTDPTIAPGDQPAFATDVPTEPGRRGTPVPLQRSPIPSAPGSPAPVPLDERASRPAAQKRLVPILAATALALVGVWFAAERYRQPPDRPFPRPPAAEPEASPSSSTRVAAAALASDLARASTALEERHYSEAAELARQILAKAPENPEALSIVKRAEEGAASLAAKTTQAKAMIDAGRYTDASRLVGEALALSPSDRTAQELASRLGDVGRRSAGDALTQMRQARSRAEAARAPELAGAAYTTARRTEQQAMELYRNGRFGEAMGKLFETGNLYRSAEIHARTEQQTRDTRTVQANVERERAIAELDASSARYETARVEAERAEAPARAGDLMKRGTDRAAEAQAKRARGDSSGARADFDAAALLMQQAQAAAIATARVETTPQPARRSEPLPAPPPPPPIPAVDDRAAVLDVVERYRSALESRNLAAVKAVWTLTPAQEDALRAEFRNARSLRVTISDAVVQVSGDAATVRCQRGYEVVTTDGQRLQTATRTVVSLQRTGDSWMIESVQHEALR